MRAMKDSGIEWIGEIPQEWRVSKVKHSYDVVLGKMLQTNQKSETDELLPYMCAANITWAGVDLSTEKQMWFSESEKSLYLLKHGDLLVTEGGDVAVSCIWMDELPQCCIQNAVHRVRPIDNASNRFLYYWLYTLKNQGYFDLVCNKATLAHFTKEKLDSCFLIVPPTDEQERIASFLDTKCAEIDALITAKEKTNALLKEHRQSIIYEAVTKGLDPTVPMKDSGVEWIGEIPEGWELKRLKYLGSMQIGLTYSPEEIVADGALVLRSSNIQDGKIVHADDVFVGKEIPEKLKVEEGDILICSRNGSRSLIGKNAVITEEFSGQTFGAFMTIFRGRFNFYIKYLLNSSVFDYYVGSFLTSTINQLTTSNLGNILVPVPSTEEEMWKIAEHIETECRTIDPIIAMNNETIQKLKEYRQSLIYEAVTGKIEV